MSMRIFIAALMALLASPSWGACFPIPPHIKPDVENFTQAFPDLQPGNYTVIFFATWCPSCKDTLKQHQGPDTILIGTWDKPEKIERAHLMFGGKSLCYFDAEGLWLKVFGGTEIPHTSRIKKEGHKIHFIK